MVETVSLYVTENKFLWKGMPVASKESANTSIDPVNWNNYALLYDELLCLDPYLKYIQQMVDIANIQPTDHVLDAGCGTGNITKVIVSTKKLEKLVAVDMSVVMLETAQSKCADSGVSFEIIDLSLALDYVSRTFDVIIAGNVLYALPEPRKTLDEFCRVLKPGGRLILATPKRGYENGMILKEHCQSKKADAFWMDAHTSPEREKMLIEEACGSTGRVIPLLQLAVCNRQILINTPIHLFTADELESLLVSCGFVNTSISYVYADQNLLSVSYKEDLK